MTLPEDAKHLRNHEALRSARLTIENRGQYEMAKGLDGKTIAFLLTDGVEQSELTEPRKALDEAGAKTVLISPVAGTVQAMKHKEKGDTFKVDLALDAANPDDYGGLVLPGGVANPDELRTNPQAVNFVRAIFDSGKPVSAICHGPWMLVEADVIRGRTLDVMAITKNGY
jgi:protease I